MGNKELAIKMREEGVKPAEIAEKLNISVKRVYQFIQKTTYNKPIADEVINHFKTLDMCQKHAIKLCASKFNVPAGRLDKITKEMGISKICSVYDKIDLDYFKELYLEKGLKVKEIAEALNIPVARVETFKQIHDIKRNQVMEISQEERNKLYDEITRLYVDESLHVADICTALNITHNTLFGIIARLKLKRITKGKKKTTWM